MSLSIPSVVLLSDCSELWFLFDSGAVSVCPADRHPLLTAATRAFAYWGGEDPGQQAFSSHSGSCGSPGSEEWSNALLVLRKTQVCKHYWRTEFFISKELHWKTSSLAVDTVLFGFLCVLLNDNFLDSIVCYKYQLSAKTTLNYPAVFYIKRCRD